MFMLFRALIGTCAPDVEHGGNGNTDLSEANLYDGSMALLHGRVGTLPY